MAKNESNDSSEVKAAPAKRVRKAKAAPAAPAVPAPEVKKPLSLEERVTELEGDLRRLCEALGKQLGEPLASQAKEIVEKHQGR